MRRTGVILLCIFILASSAFNIISESENTEGDEIDKVCLAYPSTFTTVNLSTPTLVSDNIFAKVSLNVVTSDEGKIYVAWSERWGTNYDIFLSYSTNNGTTFTTPKRVNTITNGNQVFPRLAINDAGVVFIAWWDQSNDSGDIVFTRSMDGGDSFENEICVHTDKTGVQSYPDIAVNGNDVVIVWEHPIANNTIRLWNAGDGALIRQLNGHTGAVRSVRYSPNGTILASGAEDDLVKLWNPQNGNLLRDLTDHSAMVTSVNWSSDGNMLATGSWDNDVIIWDTTDYSIITILNQTDEGAGNILLQNPVNAVTFSPDASQIAVAYNGKFSGVPIGFPNILFNLTVWNLTDYSNWTVNDNDIGHTNSVMDAAFSHNGTFLASCSKDNTVKVWNATSGAKLRDVNLNSQVHSISWSPDDAQIAAGLVNGSVVVFNLSDPAVRYWLKESHVGRVNSVSWSEARGEIASGASDPKAKVWNQTSRTERLNLSMHFNSVYSIEWSSNGNFIATGGGNSGQYQMGESQIFFTRSTDTGQSFSPQIIVSDSCANKRFRPKVDMDSNSNISAVWYDLRNGGEDIYYTNSSDGIAFSTNIAISEVPGITENVPDIAVETNGKVHIVWQQEAGVNIEIHYANSTDGFANNLVVAADGQLARIAASSTGSAIWVTWRDSGLKADVSYDYGATFNNLTNVNSSYFRDSSISVDSYAQASIVWIAGGGAANQNVYHVSSAEADNWPPTVIGTVPFDNEANVDISTSIQINFSEPMDNISVEDAFTFTDGTVVLNKTDCTVAWNDYGDKVIFTPLTPLDSNTLYTVTIANSSMDLSANEMSANYTFCFTTPFSIPLQLGWNLISVPLVQANTTIQSVLSSIDGKWDVVQYYDATDAMDHWKTYATFKPPPLNDFQAINHTIAFWIRTTEACNLSVNGTVPGLTNIPLKAGWNLVGYPSFVEKSIIDALAGTGYDLPVEGFNATAPYRIDQLADTYMMKPGEGYWVHVPADTVWVVDW